MRLQKFIAESGLASRRRAEELIQMGRVKVNGVVVEKMGLIVDPALDRVEVDAKPIHQKEPTYQYLIYHKPKGQLVSKNDPHHEKTIYDFLPKLHGAMNSVGRLDFQSEGLILITNDGPLAHQLTHPSSQIEKVYFVQLNRLMQPEQILSFQKGLKLEDYRSSPASLSFLKTSQNPYQRRKEEIWMKVVICEGKKRQVRKMFEVFDIRVIRLIRVSFGPLSLEGLSYKASRYLNPAEVKKLKKIAQAI